MPLARWINVDERANADILPRVSGAFSGTTDEILQWSACKWGFDEDTLRAQAVRESSWHQAARGDYVSDPHLCVAGDQPPCPTSFGIMQVKHIDHHGTYPAARASTALNVDYTLAVWRVCYEGYETWLNDAARGRPYGAGDEWGCVGRWYAGAWYANGADEYIAAVRQHLMSRPWRAPDFTAR